MASIFISHSSKDNIAAREMQEWLSTELGYESIFLDFDPDLGIDAGADWKQVLYDRLNQCQA